MLLRKHGVRIDDEDVFWWSIEVDNLQVAEQLIHDLELTTNGQSRFYKRKIGDAVDGWTKDDVTTKVSMDLSDVLSTVIKFGSMELVRLILKYLPAPIASCSTEGVFCYQTLSYRPSFDSAETEELIAALSEKGLGITTTDSFGRGPIWHAAFNNRPEIVEVLLRLGAKLEESTMHRAWIEDVQSAFLLCLRGSSSQMMGASMLQILAVRPDVLTDFSLPRDSAIDAWSGLLEGLSDGMMEAEAEDLQKIFDSLPPWKPSSQQMRGDTNYFRIIAGIREFERDDQLNERLLDGILAKLTSLENSKQTVQRLLRNDSADSDDSPLHAAVRTGNIYAAKKFLEAGADVDAFTVYGPEHPLYLLPFDAVANISEADKLQSVLLFSSGQTPLEAALARGWAEWNPANLKPTQIDIQEECFEGNLKVKKQFDKRTREIIRFLKEWGARTKFEIMDAGETFRFQEKGY
jgi:ankyrin repeat protein